MGMKFINLAKLPTRKDTECQSNLVLLLLGLLVLFTGVWIILTLQIFLMSVTTKLVFGSVGLKIL